MKQAYRDEGKATGRCQFCASPAVVGRTLCEKHLLYNKTKSKALSAKAAERGDCVMCRKNPAPSGKRTCDPCRAMVRARVLRLQANGLCPDCAVRPLVPGRTRCVECHERARHVAAAKRQGGKHHAVVARDTARCRICGAEGSLAVHHIDGSGQSESENNSLSNLITLCKTCHYGLERFLRVTTDLPMLFRLLQRHPLDE